MPKKSKSDEVFARLERGESDRKIARDLGIARNAVAALAEMKGKRQKFPPPLTAEQRAQVLGGGLMIAGPMTDAKRRACEEAAALLRSIVLSPEQVLMAREAVLGHILREQEELELRERALAETPRRTQSHLDATKRRDAQRMRVLDWLLLKERFTL